MNGDTPKPRPGTSRATLLGELAFPFACVGCIALLVVPLPPTVIDLLTLMSFGISIACLVAAIRFEQPSHFTSFPAVLLLTTLFRLSLNVASTRLLLVEGTSGAVVRAFGSFVVQGNALAGSVVFSVITLIQFLVVAKGSERVAEVAARFTLDAMPGKQMAIDADVRAGSIAQEQAKVMRAALQSESQVYGAMDGAMKFVKGDTIAGLVITLLNLAAGTLLGITQHGLEPILALSSFAVMTIGDGLVAQLPAILNALAAGLVVTRVTPRLGNPSMTGQLDEQVLRNSRFLTVIGVFSVCLSFLTGASGIGWTALGIALMAVGERRYWWRHVEGRLSAGIRGLSIARAWGPQPVQCRPFRRALPGRSAHSGHNSVFFIGVPTAVLHATGRAHDQIREIVEGVRGRLGLPMPPFEVHTVDSLPVIARDGVTDAVPADSAPWHWQLGIRGSRFAYGFQGKTGGEALDELLVACEAALRAKAALFLDVQSTSDLLAQLEIESPVLVRESVPKVVSIVQLNDILRRLVAEGIPVTCLREVLQAVCQWGGSESDVALLTEYIRSDLKEILAAQHAGDGRLLAFLLGPDCEQLLTEAIQHTARGSYLALEPRHAERVIRAVKVAMSQYEGAVALLTSIEVRRFVRKLLEHECPEVPVLSFAEIAPLVRVESLGRIELPER